MLTNKWDRVLAGEKISHMHQYYFEHAVSSLQNTTLTVAEN